MVLFCALAVTLAFLGLTGERASGKSHFILRSPIVIEGDDGFTADNGVVGGEGTPEEPFLLAGWEIRPISPLEPRFGIEIRNATAPFIIRGVFVHNFVPVRAGIYLENVTNAEIEGNQLRDNLHGIELVGSSNVTMRGNVISSNRGLGGIRVEVSTDVRVIENTLSDNGAGIFLLFSTDVFVSNNVLTRDGLFLGGFDLSHFTSHTVAADNLVNGRPMRFYKNCSGLEIDGVRAGQLLVVNCRNVRVQNMHLTDTDVGLFMAHVENAVVRANNFVSNSWGVYLFASSGVRVFHNNFVNSAPFDSGRENSWDDGYPSGGNYWSWYDGQDVCRGPKQDVCSGPDGIGDTPVVVEFSRDRYPLIKPFVPSPPESPLGALLILVAVLAILAAALVGLVFLRKRKRLGGGYGNSQTRRGVGVHRTPCPARVAGTTGDAIPSRFAPGAGMFIGSD